jgi:hypothetical protein
MRETTRHRLAFGAYVNLGSGRSLEILQAKLVADPASFGLSRAPGLRTLYRWSAALNWQDQLADLEREARRADAENYLRSLKDMNERQVSAALVLQQRSLQRIQSLAQDDLSVAEAIRGLVEGARLERLARGDVTDRTQVERSFENDLSGFSMAELRALAEVASIRARSDSPQGSGQPGGLDASLPPDQRPAR